MTFFSLCRASVATLVLSVPAFAADIEVSEAYARSAGHHAKSGAAFMVLKNNGDAADRLIGVSSDVAKRVELHTHIMRDGIAKMRPIEGGIELAPGGSHAMERGADHVMFMGLTEPLVDGETVKVTLVFEQAGAIEVEIPIDSAR